MLCLHVPLIGGGIGFDLAQFTLNFDNLELSYWSRTLQCSFSGCHSATVYGLGANTISCGDGRNLGLNGLLHVDVVMCLKGSDENDEHNHLVISDLVSILRFEKSG